MPPQAQTKGFARGSPLLSSKRVNVANRKRAKLSLLSKKGSIGVIRKRNIRSGPAM
jgi:hypothetical protein